MNIIIFIIISILSISCTRDKQTKDDLPVIDIAANFTEKEILLTEIADVTYLRLNSDNNEYLYQGGIVAVTKNTIVVYDVALGSILFFSRDGNPKSHFNRKGNGSKEYVNAIRVIYDEKADDVFVYSMGFKNGFLVYSSTGEFKRKLVLPQGTFVGTSVSFDDESIFIYDGSADIKRLMPDMVDLSVEHLDYPFARISKYDGTVLDYAKIPDNNIVLKDMMSGSVGRTSRLIKSKDGVYLCNPETDTVYLYNKEKVLTPIMCKTPLLKNLETMVYLNNCIDVGNYQFMQVFTARWEEGSFPFPAKYYMRDKQTGEIFRQKIIIPDYKGKDFTIQQANGDPDNGYYIELDLTELKQAYNENRLSGRLKEIVSSSNEDDDNNIYMFIQFK